MARHIMGKRLSLHGTEYSAVLCMAGVGFVKRLPADYGDPSVDPRVIKDENSASRGPLLLSLSVLGTHAIVESNCESHVASEC